jgi:macrolide-specific efflux system membrane fusion protein
MTKSKTRKAARISVLALLIAAAVGGGWMLFGETQSRAAPATIAAKRGDVQETVLATGSLEARSVVSVGAEVSGRIEKIGVKLGDTVEQGQQVVTIDSQNQQYALKAAEAELADITAQRQQQAVAVDQAQLALERAVQLGQKKLVSKLDLETAKADLESAKAKLASLDAQIQKAKLSVDTAQVNLERTQIKAPTSGTVVAVLVSEGQTVNANQTTPTLIKIAHLDEMVIKAQISEADVTRIHPGQKAWFSILGEPDKKIDAKLLSIEPAPTDIETADNGLSTEDTAVYYNGIFQVDNQDHRLRIAMTAQVTIIVDEANDVLTVPSGAVVKGEGGKAHVLVYDAGTQKTERRQVTVGLDNDVLAEVKSGLSEGEKVVATGRDHSLTETSNPDARRMMRRVGRHGFGA